MRAPACRSTGTAPSDPFPSAWNAVGHSAGDNRAHGFLINALRAAQYFFMRATTARRSAGVQRRVLALRAGAGSLCFAGPANVVGFGGFAGAMGGFLMNLGAGWFRENQGSYVTMFTIAGVAYLVAIAAIHLLAPRLEPVRLSS